MAQHISIIENSIYSKINEVIHKRFAKKNIGLASLKYEELNSEQYKMFQNCRVFLNRRKINKTEILFEIHYDVVQEQIIDIFLVK
ncbi:hypothetical protein [Capnocytophaga canimorsus]|uniref:hypothetical protein n=1 Tax=Capnocytophaga canimorsus TaxID=28188 RepID=UPI000F507849|nr:hypothetical protein [Capnocytophaga canimorsus]AYW35973.1 hypothetical protein D8L92_00550 [Capnocytophaga canimorsus]MDT9498858.1 hypothetical protein [Capnocytophaga canimorsus]